MSEWGKQSRPAVLLCRRPDDQPLRNSNQWCWTGHTNTRPSVPAPEECSPMRRCLRDDRSSCVEISDRASWIRPLKLRPLSTNTCARICIRAAICFQMVLVAPTLEFHNKPLLGWRFVRSRARRVTQNTWSSRWWSAQLSKCQQTFLDGRASNRPKSDEHFVAASHSVWSMCAADAQYSECFWYSSTFHKRLPHKSTSTRWCTGTGMAMHSVSDCSWSSIHCNCSHRYHYAVSSLCAVRRFHSQLAQVAAPDDLVERQIIS